MIGHHRRHARLGTLLASASVVLASCGIPLDDQPEVIASGDLPSTLQPPGATTTTTTSSLPPQLSEDVTIYLVDPGAGEPDLVPVTRQVAIVDGGTEIERLALEQLLLGPTNEEQVENNLTTFLVPSGDEPIVVVDLRRPTDDQLSVVLSEASGVEGGAGVIAFAQMVFTLTGFEGIEQIRFLVLGADGEEEFIPVKTDTEEGDVDRAVGREDYASLAPTRST